MAAAGTQEGRFGKKNKPAFAGYLVEDTRYLQNTQVMLKINLLSSADPKLKLPSDINPLAKSQFSRHPTNLASHEHHAPRTDTQPTDQASILKRLYDIKSRPLESMGLLFFSQAE